MKIGFFNPIIERDIIFRSINYFFIHTKCINQYTKECITVFPFFLLPLQVEKTFVFFHFCKELGTLKDFFPKCSLLSSFWYISTQNIIEKFNHCHQSRVWKIHATTRIILVKIHKAFANNWLIICVGITKQSWFVSEQLQWSWNHHHQWHTGFHLCHLCLWLQQSNWLPT